MFQTFLKIGLRHLWRTRIYAFINICGLAIGLTCVLLASIYITDERSFDNFHKNSPNLYRITTRTETNGIAETVGGTGQVQGPAFKAQVPEIQSYTRIMGGDIYGDVKTADKVFQLQMLFVDSTFFDVFSFRMRSGNPATALLGNGSVVVTEKTALKFFNRTDVIGEVLQMAGDPSAKRLGRPLVITGVVENPPSNSSIQFDLLFPFQFLQLSFEDNNWLNAYLGTFVVLKPGTDLPTVVRKFNQIAKISSKDQLAAFEKEHASMPKISYDLQAITDIHLNPQDIADQNREAGVINGSKPIYSILFLTVSGFILFMASINFINISIADSARRAKEIGIRKVTGSRRRDIFLQFIGESAFISAIAFVFAFLTALVLLPVFNQLSGKQILPESIFQPRMLVWSAAILVFNTLLSGAYPAYLLSGLTPIKVLYEKGYLTGRSISGRVLVVFQFATAITLGIAALVFREQMYFIQNKDLGYNPQEVVQVHINNNGANDVQSVKSGFESELRNKPQVRQLSLIGDFGYRQARVGDRKFNSYYLTIDEHYLDMLEMKLKSGRNFSTLSQSDKKKGVIVNEAFLRAANIENPIGATFFPDSHFGAQPLTIIGVVGNFHYNSLKERIEPLVMPMSDQFGGGTLLFKTDRTNRQAAVSDIQHAFQQLLPDAAFTYYFLDDLNSQKYQQEKRLEKMISFATFISVLICCLGLFGLAHLSLMQRRKETGIRLVLGATVSEIVILFSKHFIRLIAIALMLACPTAYFIMNFWLSDFAYHIPFPWWTLPCNGILAILFTFITVGIQSARAAAANPVLALRSE
ncbi:hypothetical protein DYBT9623_02350 [Dyadobacter sp. CECT 9623]|uniref:ABC transport system permease protein n=1 Tax=Dyadobacter linearis TaxID=2823330 RepID=A0ABM8UQD1_9BACT|nr:ABC transporter permease [Dyadobacter sp. CECT 9623]CAG5069614.1 hypothetical protein DYBT9623_02350 [Dyadobacter sp. CECT 9623]